MPSLYHVTLSCTRMGKIPFSTPLTLDLTVWLASAIETLAGVILNVFMWYNGVLTPWDLPWEKHAPGNCCPFHLSLRTNIHGEDLSPKNIVEPSTAESQPEREPPSQPPPNYHWPAASLCMSKCVLLQTTVLQKHLHATLLQQLTSKLLFIGSLRRGTVMIIAISPVPTKMPYR